MFWVFLTRCTRVNIAKGWPGDGNGPVEALTALLEGAEHEAAAREVYALRCHLQQLALRQRRHAGRRTAALVGLACLLLVRPLAGLIGLAGSGRPLDERAAISFFGIRGVGSFYYLAYAYNTAEFDAEAGFLFAVVGFVVLVSIVLHGVSSTPAMRYLERKRQAEHAAAD